MAGPPLRLFLFPEKKNPPKKKSGCTPAILYSARKAYVLSNERQLSVNDKITYLPIYYAIFF